MEQFTKDFEENDIPGTARIRKICAELDSKQLLELSVRLAKEGYEKKLWSLLSRIFEDKKGFGGQADEALKSLVDSIVLSNIPTELKLQTYTSFELPDAFLPEKEIISRWINECSPKRKNIAGFFIARYGLEKEYYKEIVLTKEIFKVIIKASKEKNILDMYSAIFSNENKEFITGAVRLVDQSKKKFAHADKDAIRRLTEKAFESKEVFFTTKLLYCVSFDVPAQFLPDNKELYKVLKISINYEERITKNFVAKYNLDFDCSDEALCRYFIGNKKATKEKVLVQKFANHLVRIEDEEARRKLLRGAFKRGGYFRMYAGCMQDGCVNEAKMVKFHYSQEDISWVLEMPGLKDNSL